MASHFENIPEEMRIRRNWIRWKLGDADANGRRAKLPWHPTHDHRVSTVKPWHWGSWEEVLAEIGRHDTCGIGYVFAKPDGYGKITVRDAQRNNSRTETDAEFRARMEALSECADPYTGIDLDHSANDAGSLEPWAAHLIGLLATYAEYSVSGFGVHLICRGVLAGRGVNYRDPLRGIAVEAYSRGRFFTFTGDRIPGTPLAIALRQALLDRIAALDHPAARASRSRPELNQAGRIAHRRHDFLLKMAGRLVRDGIAPEPVLTVLQACRDHACEAGRRPIEDEELRRMIVFAERRSRQG